MHFLHAARFFFFLVKSFGNQNLRTVCPERMSVASLIVLYLGFTVSLANGLCQRKATSGTRSHEEPLPVRCGITGLGSGLLGRVDS